MVRAAALRVAVVRFAAGSARFADVDVEAFGVEDAARLEVARRVVDRGALACFPVVSEDSVLSEGGRSKLTPLTYQAPP
ncbi:hypothetical protein ACPPVQ_08185 [Diaminobutyricibacter sp. McL0618]|uniref:hypothetical protein n=1 Tax=Leifsonia sp. McL0618 TaxID=3415677 RepID=UPI003CEA0839